MARPYVRVRIDFDEDGDFTDANEDVSSDVQQVKRTYGKNLLKQRAEAGVLELLLTNDDHVYSPSNTSSPLYPNVLPAPDIWVQIAYPLDQFTAVDATTLAGRKPTYDSAFDAWSGDTANFEVNSNAIRKTPSVGTSNKQAILDFGESDCFVGVDFTKNSTAAGLILRWVDNNNYLIARITTNTELTLSKVDGGGTSTVATAVIDAWANGTTKFLYCEMHGDTYRIYIDGALEMTTTESFNNTATKHGIGWTGSLTGQSDKWDNFGGWRSIFKGRLDTIQPRPEVNRLYCYMRAFDDMERLGKHQVFEVAPTAPNTAKQIIETILTAANVATADRILDTGSTLTNEADHEKPLGRDALTEMYQVQDDDVGWYYIDGDGFHRYEASNHRESAPHTTSRKEWFASRQADDETDIYVDGHNFKWDDGKDRVENEGYYIYYKISRTADVQVWKLEFEDKPSINNGASRTFLAIGDDDVVANPRTPIQTTDYTVNTAEGGGGTDLLIAEDSQQGTVSATGSATFQLDDTGQDFTDWNNGAHQVVINDNSGTRAIAWIGTSDLDGDGTRVELYTSSALSTLGYAWSETGWDETDTPLTYNVYNVTAEIEGGFDGQFRSIKVTNQSGSNGFVTSLQLIATRGTKSAKTAARAENSKSQTDHGRRRIQHESLHIDEFLTALDRVEKRIELRKDARERVICDMYNGTRANLMQMVHRSLSDRVTLNYSDMGIDDDYNIERQGLQITQGGTLVRSTWELQQALGGGTWGHFRWGQENW